MLSADDVLVLFEERRKFYTALHAGMAQIAAIYDGDATVNLPDLGRDEQSSVANLLAQGVDQTAGRIASAMPSITFISEAPGVRLADRRASTARDVIGGWWESDRLSIKMKQRARQGVAYGLAPAMIRYCPVRKMPTWEVRSAMEAYPALDRIPGTTQPTDVIFAYERTVGWLRRNGYGEQVAAISGRHVTLPRDTVLRCLEYVDHEGSHLVLSGYGKQHVRSPMSGLGGGLDSGAKAMTLELVDTHGIMTASVPTRLTLNRAGGQFDAMVGQFYAQSKLMALELIAVEKDIFPDTYLIGRPNETPRFLAGPFDGRTGDVNIVAGGTIDTVQSTPGYKTDTTIDRLERNQRVTAGIPSEYGGESGTNIRTGRRGDAVLSAVIDFPIAEMQEILGYALIDENKAAIALAKHYDGSETRRIYVGTGNQRKPVTYVASKVFTHDEHMVAYPVVGTDQNALLVGVGQRIGLGTMSKETGASMDPFIQDWETEHDNIIAEALEQALISGIQQQAAAGPQQGGLAPLVVAKIMSLVKNDRMELAEAFTKVTQDALDEQQAQAAAAAGPGPAPAQTPEGAMAAGAVTGLAGPTSPVPGPSQGTQDIASLMASLRTPLRGTANRVGTADRNGRVAV